jgi:hypothetical protein
LIASMLIMLHPLWNRAPCGLPSRAWTGA